MIVVVDNTTLQVAHILVTRQKLRRPRMSTQILGVVVDAIVDVMVDAANDAVADAKATTRNGATMRGVGIEIIMEMV